MNNIITNSRRLRKQMTESEKKLWQALRGRRLQNYRFRKQVPLGQYVADFVCHKAKVIIELDGGQHNQDEVVAYDQARTHWFNEQGYEICRFWNNEVLQQLEAVMGTILDLCAKRCPPPSFPSPTKTGGRDPRSSICLKLQLKFEEQCSIFASF